jgi:hypothetical protein
MSLLKAATVVLVSLYTAFGDALRKDLVSKGLPEKDFHQELFEMR